MIRPNIGLFVLVLGIGLSFFSPAMGASLTLESGINGTMFTVEGEVGTAGTLGVDYALGSYLAGGGGIGHGFKNSLSFHGGHFCAPAETNCFISTPSASGAAGALEATDHNWLQGTSAPVIVDLGAGNASDQAIVFNSTDHLGVNTSYNDPEKDLWNKFVEGIEFTVYGSNDLADALLAASTANVFGNGLAGPESGVVPGVGVGSSFEKGNLDYVFTDGWADFGATNEGDDFASVWQFTQAYRYVAVYSNFTDPLIGDGFRSFDNELDAIGRFLKPVGSDPIPEPATITLFGTGLAGLAAYRLRKKS